MKVLVLITLFFACASASAESKDCPRCAEIAALEAKVKLELPKDQPNVDDYDIQAAKIINSLGKFNDAQAMQVVSYLKFTLPADPSRSLIETIWPAITKNFDLIKKQAQTLPPADRDTVMGPILRHQNALANGQDPQANPTLKKNQ